MTGKELLLAQLEHFKSDGKIIELEDDQHSQKVKDTAKNCNVPDELIEAFYAYYKDFLDPFLDSDVYSGGPFDNDEEGLLGIQSKLWNFFYPLTQCVIKNYIGIRMHTVIEPSYEDASTITIIVSNDTSYDGLPCSIVALKDIRKAWQTIARNPSELYEVLLNYYNDMIKVIDHILDINKSYVVIHLSGTTLVRTWTCRDKKLAVDIAKYISTDISNDINDEIYVERSPLIQQGNILESKSERIWSWGVGTEPRV